MQKTIIIIGLFLGILAVGIFLATSAMHATEGKKSLLYETLSIFFPQSAVKSSQASAELNITPSVSILPPAIPDEDLKLSITNHNGNIWINSTVFNCEHRIPSYELKSISLKNQIDTSRFSIITAKDRYAYNFTNLISLIPSDTIKQLSEEIVCDNEPEILDPCTLGWKVNITYDGYVRLNLCDPNLNTAILKDKNIITTTLTAKEMVLKNGTRYNSTFGLRDPTVDTKSVTVIPITTTASVSASHTVSGADKLLVITVDWWASSGYKILNVSYGGVMLTNLGNTSISSTGDETSIWYMINPPTGTASADVKFDSTTSGGATVITYNNANQATPFDTFGTATGTGTYSSKSVASSIGDLVIDTHASDGSLGSGDPAAGQTAMSDGATGGENYGASNKTAVATSTNMGWNYTASTGWALMAVAIKSVSGGITTPQWSLNQTNSTVAGSDVKHSINWTSNGTKSMNYSIFSWCNGTYTGNTTSTQSFITTTYNFTEGSNENNSAFVRTSTATHTTGSTTTATFVVNWANLASNARSNTTQAGYNNLSYINTTNNGALNLTSSGTNHEPNAQFNFTLPVSASQVNWINVTMIQARRLAAQSATLENCRYYILNYTNSEIVTFGANVTNQVLTSRSYNFTNGDARKMVDVNNRITVVSLGDDADAGEGCVVDYVEVKVSYNQTNYPTVVKSCSDNNGNGMFTNFTEASFSGGTWSNTTKTINNTVGSVIKWMVYANDSLGYWNSTGIFNYTTIASGDFTYPQFSNNNTNTTLAGNGTNFTIAIMDNALSSYIFSTNNTGIWKNYTAVSISGTSVTAWNFTILNTTIGSLVQWRFYANDTTNNWNASEIYSLVTTVQSGEADPCIYTSGDWNPPCSCVVNSNTDLGGNNLNITSSGVFIVNADITNIGAIYKPAGCSIVKLNGKYISVVK